jgi:hypothetical protein
MFESQRAEPGVQENKPAFGQQSPPMDQDQDSFILATCRMSSRYLYVYALASED